MTYAQFLAHIKTFSWRVNDPDFDSSLPAIIRMAEARITRDVRVEQHDETITLTSDVVDLPADYGSMLSCLLAGKTTCVPVTIHRYNSLRAVNNGMYNHPVYYVANDKLKFITTASADAPIDVDITYYRKAPDFETAGTSWVADKYLDLYSFAVLTYGGDFLKDSEDGAKYEARYMSALESLSYYKAATEFGGSPLQANLPGIVR